MDYFTKPKIMNITPINLLIQNANKVFIKREDLIPCCFGGNKYRIANEYLNDMKRNGKDCIVSYGNPRSNLCRVLSMLCFADGIPCFIISPDEGDGSRTTSFNQKLAEISKAKVFPCDKSNVAESVDFALDYCKNVGLNPYYIYGDVYGKGNEKTPVEAYYQVYKNELHNFVIKESIDYIFLPVGTGMTIAGLAVASKVLGDNVRLLGISVGREKNKAMDSFDLYCNSYYEGLDVTHADILDDYLAGGYGKYNDEIKKLIIDLYNRYGIPMDPTYVGKAFWGMNEFLKKEEIVDSNILFIHTGGLPLWFDFISSL